MLTPRINAAWKSKGKLLSNIGSQHAVGARNEESTTQLPPLGGEAKLLPTAFTSTNHRHSYLVDKRRNSSPALENAKTPTAFCGENTTFEEEAKEAIGNSFLNKTDGSCGTRRTFAEDSAAKGSSAGSSRALFRKGRVKENTLIGTKSESTASQAGRSGKRRTEGETTSSEFKDFSRRKTTFSSKHMLDNADGFSLSGRDKRGSSVTSVGLKSYFSERSQEKPQFNGHRRSGGTHSDPFGGTTSSGGSSSGSGLKNKHRPKVKNPFPSANEGGLG